MKRVYREILRIAVAAILMCIYVVLNRFVSIYLAFGGFPSVRIGFSSIPILLASLLCGPLWGGVAGAGGDLIASFAFPNGTGGYLYGYTIDQALLGIIPWFIWRIFKNRRKLLGLFDVLVTAVALGLVYGLVLPSGDLGGKYHIPLNLGGRIGLGIGIAVLVIVCNILTWYFSQREFGGRLNLTEQGRVRLSQIAASAHPKKLLKKDISGLRKSDVTVSSLWGVEDISKSKHLGWQLTNLLFIRKGIQKCLDGQNSVLIQYSFLEIYSIILFETVAVKTALLAFWGQLYFGIPYTYGVFADLLTGVVTLPIIAILTYAILIPLCQTGIVDRLNSPIGSYKHK